jgi:hypothetical protein
MRHVFFDPAYNRAVEVGSFLILLAANCAVSVIGAVIHKPVAGIHLGVGAEPPPLFGLFRGCH